MIMKKDRDRCICGQDQEFMPGDPLKLGVVLGIAIEPDMRWARVVAIPRGTNDPRKVLLREFKPQDRLWPTGRYIHSSFLVAWEHDHPRPDWGPVFR